MKYAAGWFLAFILFPALPAGAQLTYVCRTTQLQFEVTLGKGVTPEAPSGRLFVVIGKRLAPEPRFTLGNTGLDTPPALAKDVPNFAPGHVQMLDRSNFCFPLENLASVKPGDYYIQAVFDTNRDLKSPNAPGNLYSEPRKVHLDPALRVHAAELVDGKTVRLELTRAIPPERLPSDSEYVKYIKIKSTLLSRFYSRPIFLRAGVILPRDYLRAPARHFPLWVHIGGYGARYTGAGDAMREGSTFRKTWLAEGTPQMLFLHLDGAGPLGDPYQVNSANHGPYGDAITQELIPYVEKTYRAIGQPYARVLDGGSTGGWVSLALQIFYPDYFNGTWSYSPDPVDFRAYQLVNIYADKNAYVNAHGFERPSMREVNGDTIYTMRHECNAENLLGSGDSYTLSGGQWGAWNATFSTRGSDGKPVPLWDPRTGAIRPEVAEQWKKYDLRIYLQQHWKLLGPKLRGKLHIWVGDADNYFLNNAVHLLDDFLSHAEPSYEGSIKYGPGKGHIWVDLNGRQIMEQMLAAIERAKP